ncbi:hypothetical protein M4D81_08830 [Paenibacillus sp. p3-SID867]|uniref:hypothetical protein n=1 Tax=Paenibacillus sp. p3-SID867 TaxID=2916363 RepID=UPI0021A57C01|nr:hypothetical protein [Paenibacillus sp. p3-SID867]MCT1399117.1 hypothetical protein [Paenibacillus sp. p3-SID867]
MYNRVFEVNDGWVREGMDRQIMERAHRWYGGVRTLENGLPSPNHNSGTPTAMAIWAAALCNPASEFYHSRELANRLTLAARYMLESQHSDGTISPGWTNFHSPPDTAFVVVGYAQAAQLLLADGWEELKGAAADMLLFLERTLPALITGGCHTPNHRWVICAALGFLNELFDSHDALKRAEEWLAEGMDATADGEWTERSNGIYNVVSDVMLIHAARLLKRPELLVSVRANLKMMSYLVHPDGEIVTEYSGRQDYGQSFDMSGYFLPCLMMASVDRDPVFQGMAEQSLSLLKHPGGAPTNAAVRLLLDPGLKRQGAESTPMPEHYRVVLNGEFPRERYLSGFAGAGHHGVIRYSRMHTDFGAPVARIREGHTSVTVSTEMSSFFSIRHGAARLLGVQFASYFDPGFVKMSRMATLEDGYRLSGVQEKGYNGPVPKADLPASTKADISPWYLLPHHRRPQTHVQQHKVGVDVLETVDGWKLVISSTEPEEVVSQISLIFPAAGALSGGELAPAGVDAQFWMEGSIRYEMDGEWIEISGGEFQHTAAGVREADYPLGCRTLLLNVVTPFEKEIHIKLSPAEQAQTEGSGAL